MVWELQDMLYTNSDFLFSVLWQTLEQAFPVQGPSSRIEILDWISSFPFSLPGKFDSLCRKLQQEHLSRYQVESAVHQMSPGCWWRFFAVQNFFELVTGTNWCLCHGKNSPVVGDGLWSILSRAPTVYSWCLSPGGHTRLSSVYHLHTAIESWLSISNTLL